MADIVALIYEDHDWFRRYFLLLDGCRGNEELTAVWEPLADPARHPRAGRGGGLLPGPAARRVATGGDPEDETDDAITDHNEIRDAVRASREHEVGQRRVVGGGEQGPRGERRAPRGGGARGADRRRQEPDLDQRHDLRDAVAELLRPPPAGKGVDDTDKDPDEYIAENS